MILEKSSSLEQLDLGKLREILRTPGPCVSIFLSPHHPDEPAHTMESLLKSNIQDARRAIAEQGFAKAATEKLLEPLEQLTGSRWGRAIYRSPEVFCQFQLAQPVKPSLTVAGCFAIRRLLAELWIPPAEEQEHVTPNRVSTYLPAIVHAAFAGRVRELYLDENSEAFEIYETPSYSSWGKEDVSNLAASQTMLHGGKAFELPSYRMPNGAMAMAILRY